MWGVSRLQESLCWCGHETLHSVQHFELLRTNVTMSVPEVTFMVGKRGGAPYHPSRPSYSAWPAGQRHLCPNL
jgi:hypothetical protein